MIDLDDIHRAAQRICEVAERTPVYTSETLDERVGARVFLKAENLQRTGSFKFRGAYNKLASLSEAERSRGVIAFSSGNHAQAVACAAALFGVPATIVMPADAPERKLAATRGHGAEVVTYGRYGEDRELIAARIQEERGLVLVRPFDDLEVIAGQGTAALELIEESSGLDVLLAPVSGGGLAAGCATALKALNPAARVFGVEPAAGDDYAQSLAAGRRVSIAIPRTIADALQANTPGELTFAINRVLLAGVVTVSDDELVDAMRFASAEFGVIIEPGGAAALAALLAGRVMPQAGERVGVILSGGNVDPSTFARLIGPA
jgi:threo-3-hydroxy-L-aspartate ammonia-lyase